jgi:hypothetical protein
MTLLSRLMLRLCWLFAPRERSTWILAMTGECTAIQSHTQRTLWAWGCACTALSWRLRPHFGFLLTLAALPLFWNGVLTPAHAALAEIFAAATGGAESVRIVALGGLQSGTAAALVFALCLHQPKQAAFTIAAVWVPTTGAASLAVLSLAQTLAPYAQNARYDVSWAFLAQGATVWPLALAGVAGWSFAHRRTKLAACVLCTLACAALLSSISPQDAIVSAIATVSVSVLSAVLITSLWNGAGQLAVAWRRTESS